MEQVNRETHQDMIREDIKAINSYLPGQSNEKAHIIAILHWSVNVLYPPQKSTDDVIDHLRKGYVEIHNTKNPDTPITVEDLPYFGSVGTKKIIDTFLKKPKKNNLSVFFSKQVKGIISTLFFFIIGLLIMYPAIYAFLDNRYVLSSEILISTISGIYILCYSIYNFIGLLYKHT